jgi:hypothetical protein
MYFPRFYRLCSALVIGVGALSTSTSAQEANASWKVLTLGRHAVPGSVEVDTRGLWLFRASPPAGSPRTDATLFMHQPLAGDGSVVSLLMALADPGGGTAGVAIRETVRPNARSLFLGMAPDGTPLLRFRRVAGKAAEVRRWDRHYGPGRLPVWLRWQREGNAFTPFASFDGFSWTQLHVPIELPRFGAESLAGVAGFAGQPTEPASSTEARITALFNSPSVLPGQLSPRVRALVGSGSVLLTWSPVPGAVGYLVRRSTADSGGYAGEPLTPSPILETSFTATRLANARPVRFLVSAVFDRNGETEEGWATELTVTPAYTPLGLFGTDLDSDITTLRGFFQYDMSTGGHLVGGAGHEDLAMRDGGHFVGQWLTGDFQITARLSDRPGFQAGLMAREGLHPAARTVMLAGTAWEGLILHARTREGTALRGGKPIVSPQRFRTPILLRLIRRGNTLSAQYSLDGRTFKAAGRPNTFRPPLPNALYVGCSVAASNSRYVVTNWFHDLTIESSPQ